MQHKRIIYRVRIKDEINRIVVFCGKFLIYVDMKNNNFMNYEILLHPCLLLYYISDY